MLKASASIAPARLDFGPPLPEGEAETAAPLPPTRTLPARGVREYWIVSWERREIEVYRRADARLQLVGVLLESDTVESPLLPGFACRVEEFFADLP